jgi:hypothetical protein
VRPVLSAGGADGYLALVHDNASRHPPAEESVANEVFVAVADLGNASLTLVTSTLWSILFDPTRSPFVDGVRASLLSDLNSQLGLDMSPSDLVSGTNRPDPPQYLVLEPHLPDRTSALVRSALLTDTHLV